MDTVIYVVMGLVIAFLLIVVVVLALRPRRSDSPDIDSVVNILLSTLATERSIKELRQALDCLPQDVLQSITRSEAARAGKLNELLATIKLAHYDRLFYFGGRPVDYVGIKYDEGVDFIEVKSGRGALSEDERKLKELIEAGRVRYVPLRVERIALIEEPDTGE